VLPIDRPGAETQWAGYPADGRCSFWWNSRAGLVIRLLRVQKHEKDVTTAGAASPAIGLGVTIAMGAMFFIYVAMENGIGIWSAEYAKRLANGITGMTTLAPMFFYAGSHPAAQAHRWFYGACPREK